METDFGDEDIHRLQRDFLAEIFARRKTGRLLPAALDFVDYHYYYASALMSAPQQPLAGRALRRIDLLSRPLAVAESTRLAIFSYEILDLLEAGEPDLRRICETLRPTGSFAAIYRRGGEVATESLAEPYYRLLERLDGVTPADRIGFGLALSTAEVREFLEFAVAEGIVVPG